MSASKEPALKNQKQKIIYMVTSGEKNGILIH